jgi:hypothetical protein
MKRGENARASMRMDVASRWRIGSACILDSRASATLL